MYFFFSKNGFISLWYRGDKGKARQNQAASASKFTTPVKSAKFHVAGTRRSVYIDMEAEEA